MVRKKRDEEEEKRKRSANSYSAGNDQRHMCSALTQDRPQYGMETSEITMGDFE